jgi:predicted acyltransferase
LVRGAASARSARRLFAAGAALAAAGAAWATVFPVNKRLWTSSYTLLTGGIAVAMLGVFVYAVARRPFTRGPRRSLTAAGANALVVYIAAEASASVLADVHVGPSSLRTWLWAHALSPWAGAMLGSFLYALVVLAACLALAAVLDRRRLYVRL